MSSSTFALNVASRGDNAINASTGMGMSFHGQVQNNVSEQVQGEVSGDLQAELLALVANGLAQMRASQPGAGHSASISPAESVSTNPSSTNSTSVSFASSSNSHTFPNVPSAPIPNTTALSTFTNSHSFSAPVNENTSAPAQDIFHEDHERRKRSHALVETRRRNRIRQCVNSLKEEVGLAPETRIAETVLLGEATRCILDLKSKVQELNSVVWLMRAQRMAMLTQNGI